MFPIQVNRVKVLETRGAADSKFGNRVMDCSSCAFRSVSMDVFCMIGSDIRDQRDLQKTAVP